MAGLVPAIHVLKQVIKEVAPLRIFFEDETGLPRPRPMLDVFLSLNGSSNIVLTFEIDELVQPISLCESRHDARAMLAHSTNKIIGDANVKDAVGAVGHDVDPTSLHGAILVDVDGRDKPGHDGVWT
jgi:hypothetical protein